MRVAVLGSGPSGLLAAWAVLQCGGCPTIYTKNTNPPLNAGVFYLHDACDLPLPRTEVSIRLVGVDGISRDKAVERYRSKIYGKNSGVLFVSLPDRDSLETVYDGRFAINLLFDILQPYIQEATITQHNISDLKEELVVNTIPLSILFPDLPFKSVSAWVNNFPAAQNSPDYVLYNANPYCSWYRMSCLFGTRCVECGVPKIGANTISKVVPSPEALEIAKERLPKNILLTGRYGAWDKNKLAHDAYYDTLEWLLMKKHDDASRTS